MDAQRAEAARGSVAVEKQPRARSKVGSVVDDKRVWIVVSGAEGGWCRERGRVEGCLAWVSGVGWRNEVRRSGVGRVSGALRRTLAVHSAAARRG